MTILAITMTFSMTCSKPRIGEFSGGYLVATGDEWQMGDADQHAHDVAENLMPETDHPIVQLGL